MLGLSPGKKKARVDAADAMQVEVPDDGAFGGHAGLAANGGNPINTTNEDTSNDEHHGLGK